MPRRLLDVAARPGPLALPALQGLGRPLDVARGHERIGHLVRDRAAEGDQRLEGPQLGAERAEEDHVPHPLDERVLALGADGQPEGAGQPAALLAPDEQARRQDLAGLHVGGPLRSFPGRERRQRLVDAEICRERMPLHGEEYKERPVVGWPSGWVPTTRLPLWRRSRRGPSRRSSLGAFGLMGDEYEQVVYNHDPASGLKSIIAIHSTALGPALGAPASIRTPPRTTPWPTSSGWPGA